MKLVILITAQNEHGLEIAQSWQRVGAPGVTILRTHGLHTLQRHAKEGSVELPRMVVSMAAAMAHVLEEMEKKGQLLLSVVEDERVDALVDAATQILGDLTQQDNGVMFVLPIERAIGVVHHDEQKK